MGSKLDRLVKDKGQIFSLFIRIYVSKCMIKNLLSESLKNL